ncbi:MAG: [protein-PII] uridylyltransferase, partial [Deltaproteobacteria bacterium]|nr:[protein-PII] uridylyltransferase [Deltaproteobacteria bacterium]
MHNKASVILKQKIGQLISSLMEENTLAFLKEHSQIIDEYLQTGFETSLVGPSMDLAKNPYAFIALGGYGRQEQCVNSDVDLLFLFKQKVPDEAESLIREIVYPLWDIGLDVGYATRSIKECLSLAGKDFEVLTSLMDARFICGMSPLYSDLMQQLREKIIKKDRKRIIDRIVKSSNERHIRFGDSTYRLEPNLKEGQGGLRDYHTILWLAKVEFKLKQPRDLEYFGQLSHEEFKDLNEALSFIWDVRNKLHFSAKRKCDQLHFENQILLAEKFKIKKSNRQQQVEGFLGQLHSRMEFIKQQHLIFLYEFGYTTRKKPRKLPEKQSNVNGIKVIRDMLNYTSSEEIISSPDLLLSIFEESMRLKIPLSAEAKRMVKEFGYLVDTGFRTLPSNVKIFERILLTPAPTFNVLKEMLSTGFLVRFIPEFKWIVNRIQYDEYHLYPVDKHLLRTVQILKNFAAGDDATDPLCVDLYKGLKSKKLLLWAALLHDIGKGNQTVGHSQGGAAIAKKILSKKGFKLKDIETVSFLIEKHLFLIKTATRRDIHDEETSIFCARTIKEINRLKMLYLLTVADSMATGPKAWNDWMQTLLRDLFLKVLNVLKKGELASREAVKAVEKKKQQVFDQALPQERKKDLKKLFNVFSPRYLLYAHTSQIIEDIKLYESLGEKDFIWNIAKSDDANTRIVKICAKDRPGLFSSISGIFTLNNVDIIDAQIFTWRNGIALDIFNVKPPPEQLFEDERWEQAEKNLQSALSGDLDLEKALSEKMPGYRSFRTPGLIRPHRIVIDNDSSSFFTIVEIFTYDFPGLLFNITDALFRCKLDIWVAKIATKADQVVDVFYVRDFDGQKADSPDQVSAIKAAIEKMLPTAGSKQQANGASP